MGLRQLPARLSGRIPESCQELDVHLVAELRWN